VKDLAPGDAVMARVANGFAGRVVATAISSRPCLHHSALPRPPACPSSMSPLYYALAHLARPNLARACWFSPGRWFGIAAIQLAKRLGARVFATAGTPQRREMLVRLGVEAAFDSRSLSFRDEVRSSPQAGVSTWS